ncbi:hydroxyacid dehydrogenase [Pseudomonas lijiangensis]|uniref:Hydroxyacid dehydrogenase n=1 Tax=Pseudomonas lijiangensis TaxID=2995658 RepID=A0ABX8HX53_9PSED|nr:hydroxyacid dehydrogenase [Pseudomonas lijiangensis]MBX8541927.1 hydroxyacid dehydrogenase [Pseudomonas cichorii]MBX8502973.1 hydroxyacid dehydrogenase [Pseudomonas lijiangensis]MBX8505129.1 hydroxyacid dehydrogenase [Pseudomonas lijiangensis]MBX8581533.1 hydroxyacid dehydrogenase [Pseudomonas cichorii]QWU84528.1 hydroxyacid dehydrogenase [Pseudomonas lijiangensis]
MTRTILLTGPELAADAMNLAASQGIRVIPTTPYLPAEELEAIIRAEQPDAIIVRQGQLTRAMIEASPRLKVIAKHGVGFNTIDIQAAAALGVPVSIAVGANAQSVAEHAFALMFSVARQTALLDARMRDGHWDKSSANGIELSGKTLGLVGLGSIGSILMDLVAPLQMKVKVYDPYLQQLPERAHVSREEDFDRLLAESDVISLHCPLTDANYNLIGAAQFQRMRPGCILINTARGELIDTQALVDALSEGKIAGAGLDTFNPEPPPADSPLWGLPTLVATPHVGANTSEARDRVGLVALRQIIDVWEGTPLDPRCVVNRHLLDH